MDLGNIIKGLVIAGAAAGAGAAASILAIKNKEKIKEKILRFKVQRKAKEEIDKYSIEELEKLNEELHLAKNEPDGINEETEIEHEITCTCEDCHTPSPVGILDAETLACLNRAELVKLCNELGITNPRKYKKTELISMIEDKLFNFNPDIHEE